jgi:hypothetical protein
MIMINTKFIIVSHKVKLIIIQTYLRFTWTSIYKFINTKIHCIISAP